MESLYIYTFGWYLVQCDYLLNIRRDAVQQRNTVLGDIAIVFLGDLSVALFVQYGRLKNTFIWTDEQLTSWFYQFFIPMCGISMLSAVSIFRSEEVEPEATLDEDESERGNWLAVKVKGVPGMLKRHIKTNYLSDMAVLFALLTVFIHGTHLNQTNSYLLAYKADNHEIKLFEARSSFDFSSKCQNNMCNFDQINIKLRNEDYRKVGQLKNDTVYIDVRINITNLPNMIRLIEDGLDWDKIILENRLHTVCKRCVDANNPHFQRCRTLSFESSKVEDCEGKKS